MAVEINRALATEVIQGDFLQVTVEQISEKADRVVMNPPFANGADIDHILHAFDFLRPGGRLVAICANGPRQAAQLRPLAESWEELPAETFREQGTNVRTVLMTITKKESPALKELGSSPLPNLQNGARGFAPYPTGTVGPSTPTRSCAPGPGHAH